MVTDKKRHGCKGVALHSRLYFGAGQRNVVLEGHVFDHPNHLRLLSTTTRHDYMMLQRAVIRYNHDHLVQLDSGQLLDASLSTVRRLYSSSGITHLQFLLIATPAERERALDRLSVYPWPRHVSDQYACLRVSPPDNFSKNVDSLVQSTVCDCIILNAQ